MTNEQEVKRVGVVPGMAVETEHLIERLKAGTVGEVVTDEELQAICGRPTGAGQRGYANLQSAIRYVLRRFGIAWGRQAKANCIKCLNASEIVAGSTSKLESQHRTAKREVHKLGVASKIVESDIERSKINLLAAQHGTIAQMSSSSMTKKLEARNIQSPMDMNLLLANFPK